MGVKSAGDYCDNMEITLASSPEVNTYMSDRIKVAKCHAAYINLRILVKKKEKKKKINGLKKVDELTQPHASRSPSEYLMAASSAGCGPDTGQGGVRQ